MPYPALQIKIHGLVQGVFFRVCIKRWARQLGIAGYVKNIPGGSVLVVAQGDEPQLAELIRRCYAGPNSSRVTHVEKSRREVEENFKTFEIRY